MEEHAIEHIEKTIVKDVKQAEKTIVRGVARKKKMLLSIAVLLVVVGGALGGVYWYVASKSVYVDQSLISAPLIELSPVHSGVLEAVFVNEGDTVTADEPVARVGEEIVKTKIAGEIVSVDTNIGEFMNAPAGQGVVALMIDPAQLRVVGHLEENKGLADIRVGDSATFIVDSFGSKHYQGIVDEISPTSRASDVVFNISAQRPTNEFDVKVRFDPQKYPELKNGMSARLWVYKQ